MAQPLDTGQRGDPAAPGSGRHHDVHGLSAFGLGLLTDLAPPGAWSQQPLAEPVLTLQMASPAEIATRWSGAEAIGWQGTIDGAPFVVERGCAGDYRFFHGEPPDDDGAPTRETRAVYHLCANARVLNCAPSNPDDPSWWRELLDSTLFTAALLHGYEALHAGAIATPNGALAITAASGVGKSTLLSELLAQGCSLLADDVLILGRSAGTPLAYPAPPLMTVPAARMPRLRSAVAPLTIATLGEEHWIAVPVHPEPLQLAGVVTLNRAPGLATELCRDEQPLAALMSSLLRFPRTRERERSRFEMAAEIARHTQVWRLDANPEVSPDTLASLLLEEFSTVVRVSAI